MIRIFFWGKHSKRTPLAYQNILRHVSRQVQIVDSPINADVVLTGFEKDYLDNIDALRSLKGMKNMPKLAVVSEEPLWEILWTENPLNDKNRLLLDGTEWTYISRSGYLFGDSMYSELDFPYIATTKNNFIAYYRYFINRNYVTLTSEAIKERFSKTKEFRLAALLEYRPQESFNKAIADNDILSLSQIRTLICDRVRAEADYISGNGWAAKNRARQASPDWLLEKLSFLDQKATFMMAMENVHHVDYVSEKAIDAFACQSIPIIYCNPSSHSIFKYLHHKSAINLYGMSVNDSIAYIGSFMPDSSTYDAYHASLGKLKKLLIDSSAIHDSQHKVATRTVGFLLSILS